MEYICLDCDYIFEAKKNDPTSLAKPRQCGKCWGYSVVLLEEYRQSKAKVQEWLKKPMGLCPAWDVVRGVFAARGLTLSPRITVRLCEKIYQEIMEERMRKF